MSESVTRFEIILPLFDYVNQFPSYTAGQNFIAQMTALVSVGAEFQHLYNYQGIDFVTLNQVNILMAFLTIGQQDAALGYIATLTSNVDSQYVPLMCVSWSAVSEP